MSAKRANIDFGDFAATEFAQKAHVTAVIGQQETVWIARQVYGEPIVSLNATRSVNVATSLTEHVCRANIKHYIQVVFIVKDVPFYLFHFYFH